MIKEFIEPSKKHEQLFVGFVWGDPILYRKFKNHNIVKDSFTDERWWFFYRLGELMYDNGVRSFDEETVIAFLDTNKTTRESLYKTYEKYGGYDTIGFLKDLCNKDKNNEEYHLSEMQKYEALRHFYKQGMINDHNKQLIDKLLKMTLVQIQQYFNHQYKNAFRNVNHGQVEFVDLIDNDLYRVIDEADQGLSMGIPLFRAPRLTKTIKGWSKGRLGYLVLPSGVGKSTIARSIYVMTLIQSNEKGIVFINEESADAWKLSMLSIVATNILKKRISRDKISEGGFDNYTRSVLKEAADWLLKNRPNMLKLAVLKQYRFVDILNWLEYYRSLGVTYCIIDTFKPDGSEVDMARWQVFSENAQDLYDLVKAENLNIGTLATLQLKIGKAYRYLDHESVAKAKEVVEVADYTMLGRLFYGDEYEGKNKIDVFNYVKRNNKWVKEYVVLDENKEHLIIFFGKNRLGSASRQIVFEISYDFNEIKEIGFAEVKPTIAY